jgi:hypothetical protein
VRAAAGLIARHPDPVARHEYAVFLARRTGVDADVVLPVVEGAASDAGPAGAPERPSRPARPERLTGQEKAEQELLRFMLANHPGLQGIDLARSDFTRPEHAAAFDLLEPVVAALDPGQPPDLGSLLGDDDSEPAALLRELAFVERPLADGTRELIGRVRVGALEARIDELRQEIARLEREGRPEESSSRLEELIGLERRRRELRSPE